MITESMMYWITRLDGLNTFMGALLFVCVCGAVVAFASWAGEYNEDDGCKCILYAKLFAIASFMFALGLVLTPTTKEMAMIYAVPAISRSDIVREDIPELYELGVEALKEKLKGESDGDDNRTVQHRARMVRTNHTK